MPVHILRVAVIALAVAVLAAAFAWQYGLFSPGGGRPGASGVAKIGGPFELVDQDGRTRKDAEFRGKLMLIYFGYTYCPDACPTALQVMTVALNMLGDRADGVVPMLITVDPARDTAERLKDYAAHFDKRLVALTGPPDAVAAAAKAYRVYYAKAPNQEGKADYLMDHSSIVYLMDREGRYVTHFTHAANPEDIAKVLRANL